MELLTKSVDSMLFVKPMTKTIDAHTSMEFKNKIVELIDKNNPFIALNLEMVEFMDSSGLSSIIFLYKHISGKNGKLALLRLKTSVRQIFTITQLDKIISIYDKDEDATNYLVTALK